MTDTNVEKVRGGDWAEALRQHALHILQRRHSKGEVDCAQIDIVRESLGPLANDAIAMVETLACGASSTGPGDADELPAQFDKQLKILIAGLERERNAGLGSYHMRADTRPQVIQSQLWVMLRRTRESADLCYAREFDLIELDRRILFMLFYKGPLVPADVSNSVGVDKAQVSRSVKRLLDEGMLEREQIRAPLRLTRKGEALGRRLMRLAELRNREITLDVSDDELDEFYATIEVLLDRARVLYEKERLLSSASNGETPDDIQVASEGLVIDRSRIVSPLMTLSSYFSRSGALAFKRLTGLSNFEAFVLSEIGIDPPVNWSSLVKALARDHSQAGRTVNALIDRGLVVREGRPGRRHGNFSPSKEGSRLHRIIHEAGAERSAFLLAPLSDQQRQRFMAIFDKINRNALAQLERERSFAERDR